MLRRRRVAGTAAAVLIAALGLALSTVGRGASGAPPGVTARRPAAPTSPVATAGPGSTAAPATQPGPAAPPATRFAELPAGRLTSPLQDAAVAPVAGGVLLAGGLDAGDASAAGILRLHGLRASGIGRLPVALHDAPAVGIGGRVYLFGGGDGSRQHAEITAVDPATGTSRTVGALPAASSDAAATTAGGIAYVVGGYTGARWLDTIVAWRPGTRARVIARLPHGIRYAAVAAAGGRIVIAGGTLPDGSASRDVFAFDPATRRLERIAPLPLPTTHGAAAPVATGVLVLGGRGSGTTSLSDAIVLVDPARGTTHRAGHLRAPRADLAAVATAGRVLLAGGREAAGTTARLSWITPAPAGSATPAAGTDVYAATAAGLLTGPARHARALVYVPNGSSDTVTVIDQRTRRIVGRYRVGHLPQHVTPSWDLTTLWVSNNLGNSLQAFDPATGRPRGRPVPVTDPYNLYFTPDGRSAIVVEEARRSLAFRDPHTWRVQRVVPLPCTGVDHMDFSAGGLYLLASCEFSGDVVRVDLAGFAVHRPLHLAPGAMPQDVKLSPDGGLFYVAEMMRGGVYLIDRSGRRVVGFVPTGAGAHGLYPSRDGRDLYVTNRSAGTVSVLRFADRRVVATWRIPGGSPDMGGVSADGRTLWLSGRYDAEVYAIDTRNGRLRARIPVDQGPHGLAVWPQPGRYSLGHTGILR